jgi:uncharacterized protein YjbJ (UPF0337 family)
MNPDELKSKWNQLIGKLSKRWAKLTEDELQQIKGNKEKLVETIQEKYGIRKEEAEKEFQDFLKENKEKDKE